jgi:hypothetical protein
MRLSLALLVLALVPAAVDRTPPSISDFRVSAEGRGFAGDRPLLAAGTIDFGRARYRPVNRMLSNLWARLSQP